MGRFDDEFLEEKVKIMQDNPKRGKSAERYEKYKEAKLLGDILRLGGSRPDIAFDLTRGFIMLADPRRNKEILAQLNDKSTASMPSMIPKQKAKTIKPIKKPSLLQTNEKKPEKRPSDDDARQESESRKRLLASTSKRRSKFGRCVGRGRLLPTYNTTAAAS